MKKLLTLFTLLLLVCSGAWGEEFTISPLNGSYLSPGNIVKVTYTGDLKTSSTQIQTTDKSKSGSFTITATAPNTYIKSVTFTDENNGSNKAAIIEKTSGNGSLTNTSGNYTYTGEEGDGDLTISVEATSKGAAKIGSVSIVVSNGTANNIVTMSNFSKSDNVITAGNIKCNGDDVSAPITIESSAWTINSSNISASSSSDTKTITITATSGKVLKYIAFLDSNCRLALVEMSSTGGTVDGASWTSSSTPTTSVTFKNGISTSLTITKIFVITEAPIPTLTGAWKIGDNTVTEANVVQGASAPTMPTFTVGATSGTPTAADNYSVAYALVDGSTAGIFTFTDGVPTAISTSTSGEATVRATLTTKDASKFKAPTTNTFDYTVTVSAASAPTSIEISGANSAARGADAITLTADVTGGVPTPTIEWFKCDDALKTNPVSQGEASTSNTTLNVATTTVGTYYYYAVASNSQGNVASNVKTITIVPKAPTITASASFVDNKDITIAKADGEDASAVIKYSTDNGENWSDYTTPLNFTETTTVKAMVVQAGLESDVVSATYTKLPVIVDTDLTEGASWDFTSYTTDERNELKNNTDFWTESTSKENKRYANKVTLSDEHLRGNDGYELSFTTGLKYTVAAVNKLRFDPDENRCWMDNGVVVIIPGLKAGQKVMADIKTSNSGGEARGMNSTNLSNVVGFNETSSERNTSYGYVTEDGDVTLTCNGGLNVYSITILPATVPVTISDKKYATFASDYDLDFSNMDDEGLYAYTATVAGDKVTFTKVTGSTAAGEGLLLYSETAKTYNVPVATDSPEKVSENKLVRGTGAAVASTYDEGATYNYVLSSKGEGDVNFYLAAGNTVPTSKAYLKNIPTTTSSKFFLPTGEDETDGIKSVQGSRFTVNGEAYNLAGQKVGADYKGIVIVNGKKVIRK